MTKTGFHCRPTETITTPLGRDMSDLQIENIINGIAGGKYIRKVGSQFGSIWGFDGLLAAEASPEQYSAFGASSNVKLCHSEDIHWLGRKWAVILAYHGQGLAQVSTHTAYDEKLVTTTSKRLMSVLGKPKEESSSGFSWLGRDGIVTLIKTSEFLQVDARRFTLVERTLAKLRSIIPYY